MEKNESKKIKSQICTTKDQSKRLLELGLKPETADCHFEGRKNIHEEWEVSEIGGCIHYYEFPAWSLHKLIEMMPADIKPRDTWYNRITDGIVVLYVCIDRGVEVLKSFDENSNLYDNIIDCIKWLIKEKYFNKEYLTKL